MNRQSNIQSNRQSNRRRKMRRHRQFTRAAIECLAIIGTGFFLALLIRGVVQGKEEDRPIKGAEINTFVEGMFSDEQIAQSGESALIQGIAAEIWAKHPEWEVNYLTPNEYSRPGDPLTEVKNIFVHYTANPGTSAAQNRSYFEQQKDTHESSVSSHFIIGYNGEILQIVPLDEIAYAVKTRNMDSISIECCYKAENGQFTQETYDSLIALLSWLTEAYDLDSEDILRHYDCGGKKCPLYYTEHEDAWERLKSDVENYAS